jgi:hypothetical protein
MKLNKDLLLAITPVQMAQKIDAATSHGIDAFIFDWYYYDDGVFLERMDGRELSWTGHTS